MTFIEFLNEMEEEGNDVEDLSSEDLNKRAIMVKKRALLKKSGRGDQADKLAIRDLKIKMRKTSDPRQKADIQRRIKELVAGKEEGI